MDPNAFSEAVVGIVSGFLERELDPLIARLAQLEQRLAGLPAPKDGAPGKSVTIDDIAPLIASEVERAVSTIPKPKDGEDGISIDVDAVKAMVSDIIAARLAQIPPPVDGKDVDVETVKALVETEISKISVPKDGKDADPEIIRQMVSDAVSALPPAEKGKDADPVEVVAQIAAEVERAVAALPTPEPGKSVTVEEMRPVVDEAVAKAVAAMPVAKDGVDAVDMMIDREGSLVFTMSDGRMKNVGLVVGRDGVDIDMAVVGKQIADHVAAIPQPKDGLDGFGFDDMDVHHDGERGFTLRFTKGDRVKEFPFKVPVVLDRGVYKDDRIYVAGDGVTWGGSFWIAQGETAEKPDSGKGWRLAVKKGRDGKDGIMKAAPKSGPVKVG